MGIRYLPAIDGLRAIAVLAVVAYHAGLPVPAGFVGVDVFFVISGYLITGLLANEYAQTGRISLAGFYARRVRRILPALLLVVGATLLLGTWLLPASAQAALARSAIAGLGMFANVHFQHVSGGYFDADAETMPMLHLWTLSVEEQFYLLWPALLFVLLRYRVRWAVSVLAIASMIVGQYFVAIDPEVAFYQMPTRYWELAAGGLLALYPVKLGRIAGVCGTVLLLGAVALPVADFPGAGALPAVLAAMLLIVSPPAFLSIAPLRYVGLISYSLYLWHWPLLAIYRVTSQAPTLTGAMALCVLAGILAALSYRFVETPFRKARSHRIVASTAATGLALALLAGGLLQQAVARGAVGASILVDRPDRITECHVPMTGPPVRLRCIPPDARMAIWGDSHALMWRPFAQAMADRQGAKLAPLTMDSCAPALGFDSPNPKHPLLAARCHAFNLIALEYLRTHSIERVYLGVRLTQYPDPSIPAAGIERAIASLPSTMQVVVMAPTPTLPHASVQCAEMGWDCSVPRSNFDAQAGKARAALAGIASRHANVTVIDATDFFCTATICPMMREGRSLYWDDDHIAASAAMAFSASLGGGTHH